mgnify:CR=1 FL=1
MQRDGWYSLGLAADDLERPEAIGRRAAERTVAAATGRRTDEERFSAAQVDASDANAVAALAPLMPDFAAHLGDCRFHNCSHRHEPGCGVRAALDPTDSPRFSRAREMAMATG